ncbi:uncharacterized protein OCT59_009788 [Rhizophagus irregularis]|uniref:Hsp70 family protein n=2 Tax=Rhizophagus irregularis TaxID=588596 RepID=A0A015M5G6_RHIIW|nr:hypothetical protein RirG_165070 [Rhizophagus irregularis DAOM 197198w]UZO18475.1 hypothetical protein OCT59_009788 [Rhizophagus irregularis]CAG8490367.1 7681_t:CDS:2 [Rhizophagus irregularis]
MASGIAGTILKLKTDFKKAKDECANLVEENKNLKQEIQVLKEKLQEKDKQIEKLQERDEEFEKLQQHVQNLEKQRNEELLQLQELEMISQDFQNELGLSELDETKENDIKVEENNEQQNYDSNDSTTFPSVDQNKENNKQKSSKKSFLYNNRDNFSESMNNEQKSSKESFIYNNSDGFSESLKENTEKFELNSNIQAVVGLDFGTTYSGFACCHVSNEEYIYSYDSWSNNRDYLKMQVPTVLDYNYDYYIEFFKLYLGDSPDNLKPKLPVEYKKAITDFFRKISEDIKKEVQNHWLGIDFFENVLLVLTVPMGFSEKDKDIMRECVYDANLIRNKCSKKLQFITESEAAALYCMKNELEEHDLLTTRNSFMIVDNGGCTVDLSTCKLVGNNPLQLGKVTEYIRDFCVSTFINEEFIKFLREKLGNRGIDLLMEVKYDEFQGLVNSFCHRIIYFSDDNIEYHDVLNVNDYPYLKQYVSKEIRKIMEENDWVINVVEYNDIKKLVDLMIDRIIRLIHIQISNSQETCSGIFLVGGFSENEYLQERIKQEFHHKVNTISVPYNPTTVIAHGAVIYGLSISSNLDKLEDNTNSSSSRVLDYTYGIQFNSDWKNTDPPNRKTSDGKISKFISLVKRGTEVTSDQVFSFNFKPESGQAHIKFEVYYTNEDSAMYIDEPGMKLLGVLNADLPDTHLDNRSIDFGLIFGQNEITAFARNELNGQKFVTTFYYQ